MGERSGCDSEHLTLEARAAEPTGYVKLGDRRFKIPGEIQAGIIYLEVISR